MLRYCMLPLIFLFSLGLCCINDLKAQSLVSTDKTDYAPGETVMITGTGFQPGEIVTLQVRHANDEGENDNDFSTAHQPFETIADAEGNIQSSWEVPSDQDEMNEELKLTADGQSSGLHAEFLFTDSVTNVPASGGTNISADKAANSTNPVGGQFTSLGNITIVEQAIGDFPSGSGTFLIKAPTGWIFNTAAAVTVTSSGIIVPAFTGLSATVAATQITIGYTAAPLTTIGINTVTISGIQVKASNGAVIPQAGNLTTAAGSGGAISGIVNMNVGALSLQAGVPAIMTISNPGPQVTGVPFSVTVTVKDQFGTNLSTTATMSTNGGTITPGTAAVSAGTFTGSFALSDPGTKTITATAGTASATSAPFAVTYVNSPTDNFRTKTSGNWNDNNTWESQPTTGGPTWFNATLSPTSAANSITVRNTHVVNITAAVSIDQTTVDAGGQLIVNNAADLTVVNGAGTDLIVNGSLVVNGNLINQGDMATSIAATVFNAGGRYIHDQNGGAIPVVTWTVGSTCEIRGITNSVPSGLNQSFQHFTWNCINQSAAINSGIPATILGNLTIDKVSATTNTTSYVTFPGNVSIGGDMIINSGTIGVLNSTANVNVAGNFTMTGGSITNTALIGTGLININFNGTTPQLFSKSGGTIVTSATLGTATNNFSILSGATLNFGSDVLNGNGNFILNSGGTIITANNNGLGASGSIQLSGTKTLNSGGNFEFRGTNTGVFTTTTANTVNDLTVNRAGGVTMDMNITVNGTLNFISGVITPGANNLVISGAGNITNFDAAKYVNGKLQRVFNAPASKTFPVGKLGVSRPVEFNTLAGSGTVSVEQFESALTGSLPASTDLVNARYWDISQNAAGITSYKLTLNGTGISPNGPVVILKKQAAVISASATTTPNYTNTTAFNSLSGVNSFALGSTCTVTADAGPDQVGAATCGTTQVTLAANAAPLTGQGTWTIQTGNPSGTAFSAVHDPAATFSGIAGGSYVLRWTIVNGSCSDFNEVNISFNTVPGLSISPIAPVGNILNTCSASVSFGTNVTVTGFPAPSVQYKIGAVPVSSPRSFPVGTTAVTVEATNLCTTTTDNFNIVVNDVQVPVINCPAPVTISCEDATAPANTGTATATDNCTLAPAITSTDVSTQDANVNNAAHYNYTITRTWRATDASTNFSECVQSITVHDVTKPIITCPADVTVNCQDNTGTAANGTATATDNCSPVTITSSDVSTQDANVNNAAHYNYTITRTWRATDVTGNYNECVQTITVHDITKPMITCPADVTVNCQDNTGTATNGTATATDNCSPVTITSSDVSTQDANVNNAAHYNYTITRTWRATDVTGNFNECVQLITVQDITKPIISCPAAVTLNCQDNTGIAANGTATATDNCSPVTITFSDVSTQDANVNNAAHYNYTITRTWRATDVTGNYNECVQLITVQDITKPSISCPAAVTLNCQDNTGTAANGTATATDNCSPVTITSSDVSTQDANVNNAAHYNYSITRTWRATDVTGNYNECVQLITVQDITKPIISCPAAVTLNCQDNTGTAANGTATATDNCSPVTITSSDVSTQDANVNNAAHYNYTITRTWRATDVTGNYNECVQVITVQDITKPTISCPAAVTLNCQDNTGTAANGTATATDNCSPVTITSSDVSTQDANVNNIAHYNYTITRTWRATDVTGNYNECIQTLTVHDITAPLVTCPANILLTACQDIATWSAPLGADNCSPVTVTRSGAAPGSSFGNGTVTTIMYTAKDVAGNQQSCSFTVTRPAALQVTGSNSNPQLYFGYTGDQSAIIKAIATGGGKPPYKISITMNRPLKCNFVNDAGDETWTSTGTNLNTACPADPGLATLNPSSTITGVGAGGALSVTVTLMADAIFTATVTDADGCEQTYSTKVEAEDVRCFAGNSGRSKVTICHKTGSSKNPCVKICVDESAVQEHLDHGDFLGNCTPTCMPPVPLARAVEKPAPGTFDVKASPNPFANDFKLLIKSGDKEPVSVRILDMFGRVVFARKGIAPVSTIRLGNGLPGGSYYVEVMQGTKKAMVRLLKIK